MAISHRILPIRFLNRAKFDLLKSRVVILCFALPSFFHNPELHYLIAHSTQDASDLHIAEGLLVVV